MYTRILNLVDNFFNNIKKGTNEVHFHNFYIYLHFFQFFLVISLFKLIKVYENIWS